MPHKYAETNRQVMEHNLYPLEYQLSVETFIHRTGQYVVHEFFLNI